MKKTTLIIFSLMLSAVFITGCTDEKGNTVNMATKPMTEQYILGSMFELLVDQETDLQVKVSYGVGGGTSNIHPAMLNKEFDIYPEYTGTGWSSVLKETSLYTEDSFSKLQSGYAKMDMQWAGMVGFNNTYGIAVRNDIAEKYQLKTYSDLQAVSDKLTFGAEYDFYERDDGYDSLCNKYNLKFKDTVDLDIGLKYDAIGQKKIDVMNIFTTDGQLSISNLTILEDDRNLYPSYMCGFVVRNEILTKHPELEDVLSLFEGLISDADMTKMNYQVEGEGQDPEDVARRFLKDKGLLK